MASINPRAVPHRQRVPRRRKRRAATLKSVCTGRYLPANTRAPSPKTERLYLIAIRSLNRHLEREATLRDLSDATIGGWMRALRSEGLSIATINSYRAKLLALWNWCAKKRLVDDFPTVASYAAPEQIPDAWTVDQVQSHIDACDKMKGEVDGVPAPLWWRTLYMVAFDTGERTGATLAIRWSWLDLESGTLAIPAEYRKGKRKASFYRLREPTVALLRELWQLTESIDPGRENVFSWPWDQSFFYYRQKQLLKFAGLPYVKHRSGLQKLRRTFASYIEKAGGSATEALKHSSRAVTTGSYLDPRIIDAPPANALLPAIDVHSA